jgi:hypothetical protein
VAAFLSGRQIGFRFTGREVSNDWVPYLTLNLDPIPSDAAPESIALGQYLRILAEAVKRVG